MGEYYNWVNVDKKEYISPGDFDYGNKFHESIHKDSVPLYALHSLLVEEWKGDHILWIGDESPVSEKESNYVLKNLYAQSAAIGYSGYVYDMVFETYRNVSGLFKEAEEWVRPEIDYYLEEYRKKGANESYNPYRVDPLNPYKGLFSKKGKRYRYTINHTKKTYYSLDGTEILFQNHTRSDCFDPLPILLAYGRMADPGEWLGDVIGVSDQRPEGYSRIHKLYLNW